MKNYLFSPPSVYAMGDVYNLFTSIDISGIFIIINLYDSNLYGMCAFLLLYLTLNKDVSLST